MAQAVSRRSLTAESRVRFLVCPCKICGGQKGTGTSCPEYFAYTVSVQFHQLSIIIFIFVLLLPEGHACETWEPSNTAMLFRIATKHWTENCFHTVNA